MSLNKKEAQFFIYLADAIIEGRTQGKEHHMVMARRMVHTFPDPDPDLPVRPPWWRRLWRFLWIPLSLR